MAETPRPTFDDAWQVVKQMVRRGAPFEHIEAFIDNSRLLHEERAILWLYAWCDGQARELRELVNAGATD
jgi:hypothetical protein